MSSPGRVAVEVMITEILPGRASKVEGVRSVRTVKARVLDEFFWPGRTIFVTIAFIYPKARSARDTYVRNKFRDRIRQLLGVPVTREEYNALGTAADEEWAKFVGRRATIAVREGEGPHGLFLEMIP